MPLHSFSDSSQSSDARIPQHQVLQPHKSWNNSLGLFSELHNANYREFENYNFTLNISPNYSFASHQNTDNTINIKITKSDLSIDDFLSSNDDDYRFDVYDVSESPQSPPDEPLCAQYISKSPRFNRNNAYNTAMNIYQNINKMYFWFCCIK